MINFFNRIYNWVMGLVIQYQEYKTKNFQRHNCSYCGGRYLFDVPIGVPVEEIVFVCKDCEVRHTKTFDDNDFLETTEEK